MEEEAVRRTLPERLATAPTHGAANWVAAIRALLEPLGGADLPEIERETLRDPPDFAGPSRDSET